MIIIYITAALLSMHSVSSYAADSDADRAKSYDYEECIEPDSEDTTSEGTTPPYTDDDTKGSSDEESDYGYEPDGLYEPDKEREAQEREAAQFIKKLLEIVDLNSEINRHKGPIVLPKKTNIGCVTDIWNTHTESWRTTAYNRKDRDRKHPVFIIERNEIVFYHITKAILAEAAIHYRSTDGEDKKLFAHLIKLCLAFIYRATKSVLVKVPDERSEHENTLFKLFKEMLCEAFNVTSISNAYGYADKYLKLDEFIRQLIIHDPELNFWSFCHDLAPDGCVRPTDLD